MFQAGGIFTSKGSWTVSGHFKTSHPDGERVIGRKGDRIGGWVSKTVLGFTKSFQQTSQPRVSGLVAS